MRTFGAIRSGVFLLTDNTHRIEKVFDVGDELILYHGTDDLIKLVKCYLSAEDERREISSKAHERAHREHTYKQRVAYLLARL